MMVTLNTTGKVISRKMRVGRGIGSGKGKTSGRQGTQTTIQLQKIIHLDQ